MLAEATVLISEQQIEVARIDLVRTCRQPPAAVAGCKRPQQAALAIEHQGGVFQVFTERRRSEGEDEGGRRRQCEPGQNDDQAQSAETPPLPARGKRQRAVLV